MEDRALQTINVYSIRVIVGYIGNVFPGTTLRQGVRRSARTT